MTLLFRSVLSAALVASTFAWAQPPGKTATAYKPTPPPERRVGVAYTTWHVTPNWNKTWGTPTLGFYKSDDRKVIDQHAAWLADAGVDFVWIDWWNNIQYQQNPNKANPTFDTIEGATTAIFDEYATRRAAGKNTPNISIFAGVTLSPEAVKDGRLQCKADQIYKEYVANPRYARSWNNISAIRC